LPSAIERVKTELAEGQPLQIRMRKLEMMKFPVLRSYTACAMAETVPPDLSLQPPASRSSRVPSPQSQVCPCPCLRTRSNPEATTEGIQQKFSATREAYVVCMCLQSELHQVCSSRAVGGWKRRLSILFFENCACT
jgi:hypothetical protein